MCGGQVASPSVHRQSWEINGQDSRPDDGYQGIFNFAPSTGLEDGLLDGEAGVPRK